MLRILVAITGLSLVGQAASAQSVSTNRVASHRLGFSGATVSVREDYSHTKWPVAHRYFLLKGANGRVVTTPLRDGGASELSELGLYANESSGGGDFWLIGGRDCLRFDPVNLKVSKCVPPPCVRGRRTSQNLTYVGAFDWANGFDPPKGRFQFGWRFLPPEDGSERSGCAARSAPP